MHRPLILALTLAAAALAASGCRNNSDAKLKLQLAAALRDSEDTSVVSPAWHRGPGVSSEETGTARFVPKLLDAYRLNRAQELLEFVDGFYRAPGNEGYEAVIDRLAADLREQGFGTDARLVLEVFESDTDQPAWTPRGGAVELLHDGQRTVLHQFSRAGDPDRTMLPIHAVACDLTAPVVMHLDELEEGSILVTEAPMWQVLPRAAARKAAGVVSASLETFNADPTGKQRHLDAIQFRTVPEGTTLPTFQISPRSFARISDAAEAGAVQLKLSARVDLESRPLRTLSATVVGAKHPEQAAVVVSHVQEPGACDNATGVVGLAESVRGYVDLLKRGELDWPSSSVAFVWGDEFVQSEVWLAESQRTAIIGISSDMTGESYEQTGAIALLERMPDPGALKPLAPDQHTPWGAGEVTVEDLSPNGLAVIARCAMIDVGRAEGGWHSADHPWEGGSDHDVFAAKDIPAVLFWHFTDFAYHTSLDRLDKVDPSEMRRTAACILATALAVADARPEDLKRYLDSLQAERDIRLSAAEAAGQSENAEHWKTWTTGARHWLRQLCLGIE